VRILVVLYEATDGRRYCGEFVGGKVNRWPEAEGLSPFPLYRGGEDRVEMPFGVRVQLSHVL
jgi:hypothetical protein